MATVYLPLGWTQIGESFSNVIYQGTMARLHNVVSDPRTGNQVFERKNLSDVAKMRSMAGSWAKSSWKLIFGSKWATIIYQMAKGNVNNYWTEAEAVWNSWNESNRQVWRENSPYLVTWNDPGKIFYQMYSMLWWWAAEHGVDFYYQPLAFATNSADCKAWWLKTIYDLGWQFSDPFGTYIDDRDPRWVYSGTWNLWNGTGPREDTLTQGQANGDYAKINLKATQVRIGYMKNTDAGEFRYYVNGVEAGIIQANGAGFEQAQFVDIDRVTVEREYRVVHTGSSGQKLNLDYLFYYLSYYFLDVDLRTGSWQSHDFLGQPGTEYYESVGGGVAVLEFNFVGAWLKFSYRKKSTCGLVRVYVDGVHLQDIDQFAVSEVSGGVLLGRFKMGLHHVRMEKVGPAQMNYWQCLVVRNKSDFTA